MKNKKLKKLAARIRDAELPVENWNADQFSAWIQGMNTASDMIDPPDLPVCCVGDCEMRAEWRVVSEDGILDSNTCRDHIGDGVDFLRGPWTVTRIEP